MIFLIKIKYQEIKFKSCGILKLHQKKLDNLKSKKSVFLTP